RNFEEEKKLRSRLTDLGFRFNEESHKEEYGWKIIPARLPEIVDTLLKEEWFLIAEGKSYKAPQSFQLRLSSGEDWFQLDGEADFGDEKIVIPELMQASERGERYVQLGDGSYGVLPEDWLKHYTVLTQLGEIVGDGLRFRKSQGLIIEYLLQELLESSEPVQEFIQGIEDSAKIDKVDTPKGFKGELRPYQKNGLSWLKFIRKIGVGGILADDMGLGKTVQILALLASVKEEMTASVLLIVPRSLIFNWIEEVEKFTPHLSIMEYGGPSRKQLLKTLTKYDIVITTYGTVRQDIEKLSKEFFEYCILDEAQVIKNRDSSTHKAIRLINAKHRISMSGTPIENSLSDLVSQFEFLNPGITGHGKLSALIDGNEKLNKETLSKLKKAFKPFILRRTKNQVAKDLPPKTEQVIYCEMEDSQKSMYSKMLKFYQQGMVEKEKEGKANIEYLGALTRLRQMACHPLLVSEDWTEKGSAKLDLLIDRLKELISEGHRALVFSQFTSFLALIKDKIEENSWDYCYLDGQTKNRQEVVNAFQTSDTPLFLISLKAGGVGLNLTAADYVFLMDPWWNPAIESQAIDRAYRIGQDKHVIACKFITRDTVEEKVLKMQRVKRYLADSIIDDNDEIFDKLTVQDFKELLY
ncbi:MAG: DEAD/DEAH box helicase, partial [Lentisphaeraceae bacterium]|nr:DEAD/DEAH box helicase [Lentisphaeraceae bacterium]